MVLFFRRHCFLQSKHVLKIALLREIVREYSSDNVSIVDMHVAVDKAWSHNGVLSIYYILCPTILELVCLVNLYYLPIINEDRTVLDNPPHFVDGDYPGSILYFDRRQAQMTPYFLN